MKKIKIKKTTSNKKKSNLKPKNTTQKKGTSEMWWIMASVILALVVVVLILVWFKSSGDTAFTDFKGKIGGTGDCDNDKVADLFDKCVGTSGDVDNNEAQGCPAGQTKDPEGKKKPECCVAS